jgi:hypothetical protein
MAAGNEAKGASAGTQETTGGRVSGLVSVLQRSVNFWAQYAKDAAQLFAEGNLNPGEWAQKHADLWSGLAGVSGELTALAFPGQANPAPPPTRPPVSPVSPPTPVMPAATAPGTKGRRSVAKRRGKSRQP